MPGEDYILRVSAYLEYDDLGLNKDSGYYDAIHNLTDCEITIFTGQNINQYVWNTTYRGNCVTTKTGSQVTIYRDIDLRDYSFNWNNVPNNQIALQSFQLYPGNTDFFDVQWLFAYGGECSETYPCERSVQTALNLPKRRFTSDSQTYSWISSSKIGKGTQLDNFRYYSAAGYCDENIDQNGINWWGIYSYTPCFKNR